MPGSGKTTIGKKLAKLLDLRFVDTDDLLETRMGMSLAEYRQKNSDKDFAQLEEKLGLDMVEGSMVVATGGSMALHEAAMQHMGRLGLVVHIDVPLALLKRRLVPVRLARVTGLPQDGLPGLLRMREPHYRKYRDIHYKTGHRNNSSAQSRELADIIHAHLMAKNS